ncbi:response regulator [Modestobacter excelsi]|uniref:response regulator n=1 Tax=Modestobacter excelsi TaxID=2213161 RepID=UPI001C20D25F|nr:response regulator transcription factor [Modestobacter excelsi]
MAVGWMDGDPIAVYCIDGCPLRVEQVVSAVGRDRAGMLGDVEQMAAILERAVLDTTEAFGLTDPRVAAELVAGAWADILRQEGRPPRLVELTTAAVREVGDHLHRRQVAGGPRNVRDARDHIRVLVVDDHPVVRLRLVEMFAGQADLSVVGECENGPEVVEATARLRPHVVCMDRSVPIGGRLAATQTLRAARAEVRIVLLSAGSEARREMALAGADALVPEDAGPAALLRCVRTVARRGTGCPHCL